MEDYKKETIRAFDKYPNIFDEKFGRYLPHIITELNRFSKMVNPPYHILDIGSGPGNQAQYLQDLGNEVLCIDLSKEMVRMARKKGLAALVMDLEDLSFSSEFFDGVIAYTSLLHIPKENLENVLRNIFRIMKNDAVFFLGMKQGEGDGFVVRDKYPGTKRYFSLYNDGELREYLNKLFNFKFFSKLK